MFFGGHSVHVFTVNGDTEWLNFRFNQLPPLLLDNLLNRVTVESTDSEAGWLFMPPLHTQYIM